MEPREPADDQKGAAASERASGWGCTVLGLAGLLGIVVALRWSAPAGIALFVIAAILGWRRAKRSDEIAQARSARIVAGHGSLVGDVWRRLFAAEGLGDIVDRLAPHVRPAIRVATTRVDAVAVGASRIGGIPDLPAGMGWPRHENVSLGLLAQFDLREVAQTEPGNPLPRSGHLWFFLNQKDSPISASPANGAALVLYAGGDAALVRAEPPADLSKKNRFPLCAVTLEAYDDIPDPENEPWLNDWLDEARHEMYCEIQSHLESGLHRDPHKLLGYAGAIQSSMELECEVASRGVSFAKRTKEMEARAGDWRLLFQVESDGQAGMMWGDAGRLYFWIRDEDLRAARFDRTWIVFQCH